MAAEAIPTACNNMNLCPPAPAMAKGANDSSKLRGLYLFAGHARRTDLPAAMSDLLQSPETYPNMEIEWTQVDILRNGAADDLLDDDRRQGILEDIRSGKYHFVIASPPCSSWSRAVFKDHCGPRPIRSRQYPLGFPWLSGKNKLTADQANVLVLCAVSSMRAVAKAVSKGHSCVGLLEFPEDLGVANLGIPASIWQLRDVQDLLLIGFMWIAMFQCWTGLDASKPTRFLSNAIDIRGAGIEGPPTFDKQFRYLGPLTSSCCQIKHQSLTGKLDDQTFRTTPTAQYPKALNELLANILLNTISPPVAWAGSSSKSCSSFLPPVRVEILKGEIPSGALYIGRGTPGRRPRSRWANPFPIGASCSRSLALDRFSSYLQSSPTLLAALPSLGGARLCCHCKLSQDCHGDLLIRAFESTPLSQDASSSSPPQSTSPSRCPSSPSGVIEAPDKGGFRPYQDGAGLCSQGRLPPCSRPVVHTIFKELRAAAEEALASWGRSLPQVGSVGGLRKVLFELGLGRYDSSPFPKALIHEVHQKWLAILKSHGHDPASFKVHRDQPIDVALLRCLLLLSEDPDVDICDHMSIGVALGVDCDLPRLPLVFEEKTKWKVAPPLEHEAPRWMDNYNSISEHHTAVQEQFQKDQGKGWMLHLTLKEATARWGKNLRIAALGAILKKQGSSEVRVIFDATHGVLANGEIRVHDLLAFPMSGDIQALMHRLSLLGKGAFLLVYDFSSAHRLIPVRMEDWGYQTCRLKGDVNEKGEEMVWVNTVGTFGVSSAAYWWSRAGGALVRVSHHLLGQQLGLWHCLFSDDGLIGHSFPEAPMAMLMLLLYFDILRVPLSWKKVRGGTEVDYIGYRLSLPSFSVGLSEKRASWLDEWLTRKASEGFMLIRELSESLGRLGFASGPLRWIRPSLGPLHAWAAACPDGSYQGTPTTLRIIMFWLAHAVRSRRMVCCRSLRPVYSGELFRTDAKAEGKLIVLGGWSLENGFETKQARWFSLRITEEDAPWLFRIEPFRVIAALELLGSLLGLMLLVPDALSNEALIGSVGFAASTDNQGNARLVEKHMTTKMPLSLVLLELSSQLQDRNMVLDLRWLRREENQPADDLTNEEFSNFSESLRVAVSWKDLDFKVLHTLAEQATSFSDQLGELKRRRKEVGEVLPVSSSRGPKLRERDPW